jgi:hypothetical protein
MAVLQAMRKRVLLRGLADIMFDRYAGDNTTELRSEDKLYFGEDNQTLILPSSNLMSFLCAENTPSAAKRFIETRKYKAVAHAILSYTSIEPFEIPLLRNGEPIKFTGFDEKSGVYIHNSVARLAKGIPNPKTRPVVRAPWELEFTLNFYENKEVQLSTIRDLFVKGGVAIGLGTFRGVYGKFQVAEWE